MTNPAVLAEVGTIRVSGKEDQTLEAASRVDRAVMPDHLSRFILKAGKRLKLSLSLFAGGYR